MSDVFLAVQDRTGDSKYKMSWNNKNQKDIEMARDVFVDLKERGYRIFSVKKILGFIKVKGEEVDEFNPNKNEFYYEQGELEIKNEVGENQKERVRCSKEYSQVKEKEENTFSMEDVEMDNIRYDDAKLFNPEKEKIDSKRDYVATKSFYAG